MLFLWFFCLLSVKWSRLEAQTFWKARTAVPAFQDKDYVFRKPHSSLSLSAEACLRQHFVFLISHLYCYRPSFQEKDALDLHIKGCRMCGEHTSHLVCYHDALSTKTDAPQNSFCTHPELRNHVHPGTRSNSNSCSFFERNGKIFLCLSVPIRTVAFRAHPGNLSFSWDPLMRAFQAFQNYQLDLFHSLIVMIIRLRSMA